MQRFFVWSLAVFNVLLILIRLWAGIAGINPVPMLVAEAAGFVLVTILFSVMGALIVVRTDGNRVGWLMLLLGFVLADPFRTYLELNFAALTGELSPSMYFAIWTQGWFYFVILYAVFLILLQFPDGRPPTPRWNWVRVISLLTFGQYVLVYTFQPQYGDANLLIDNPIALLPISAEETISGPLFGLGLIFLAISSLVSIFIRYRRAGPQVRAQIKWLLYAGAFSFAAIAYRLATYDPGSQNWTDYLLILALLAITLSISIAILRYRLYDIDLLIRRTLQYALLTGILGLVFFGSIVILQSLFQGLTGSRESPLITVFSTLLIAALFNPLRVRTQNWIDRRFYRVKYDAEKALADFALSARDEVDIQLLTSKLFQVVTDTLQPEDVQFLLSLPPEDEIS